MFLSLAAQATSETSGTYTIQSKSFIVNGPNLPSISVKPVQIKPQSFAAPGSDTERYLKQNKAERAIPPHYNAKLGSNTVEIKIYPVNRAHSDVEMESLFKTFCSETDYIRNSEIVKKGNLPGDIKLKPKEIRFWKTAYWMRFVGGKGFLDYSGEFYRPEDVTEIRLVSKSSPYDPGEEKDFRNDPGSAFNEIIFVTKLHKNVVIDDRLKLAGVTPLFFVPNGSHLTKDVNRGDKVDPKILEQIIKRTSVSRPILPKDKTPNFKLFPLGDINANGAFEFLFVEGDRPDGENFAEIYELHSDLLVTVWTWSDFID